MTYQIVPLAAIHLDQVEEIEKACFDDPWSRRILEESLSAKDTTALAALTEDGVVLGYIFFTAILDEGGVDNIAVLPAARRQGIASALLEAFHGYGRAHGLTALFLEVRPSNEGAAALYRKLGYKEAGRRKNYYLNPKEDAIIMKLEFSAMYLKTMTPEELRRAYETDLKEAFPPAELKPLRAMEAMREKGIYDPLCLMDGAGEVQGYILLWKHEDGRYILVDYLCVPAGRRNSGTGGKLLRMVRDHYPKDTVFIGESEAPSGDPEADGLILRRLGFYARNGAVTLGYDNALFGVHFKTICWADPMPDEAEIMRKHQEIYLRQFGREKYDAYIQIPLHPGEKCRPVTDWTE